MTGPNRIPNFIGFLLLAAFSFPVAAEEPSVLAIPEAVSEKTITEQHVNIAQGLVFIELFSSPSCQFCPQAERNFNDILSDPAVIGYICMVPYFSGREKAELTKPFCSDQQGLYAQKLTSGMRYTPQMIINGQDNVPGQRLEAIINTIRGRRERDPSHGQPQNQFMPMDILMAQGQDLDTLDAILPHITGRQEGETFALRIVSIRQQVDATSMTGTRQRRDAPLRNVAVGMKEGGFWDGRKTIWRVPISRENGADAVIIMAQDRNTGAIVAAGQAVFPSSQASQ